MAFPGHVVLAPPTETIQPALIFLASVTASSVMYVCVCTVALVKTPATLPSSILCRPALDGGFPFRVG